MSKSVFDTSSAPRGRPPKYFSKQHRILKQLLMGAMDDHTIPLSSVNALIRPYVKSDILRGILAELKVPLREYGASRGSYYDERDVHAAIMQLEEDAQKLTAPDLTHSFKTPTDRGSNW